MGSSRSSDRDAKSNEESDVRRRNLFKDKGRRYNSSREKRESRRKRQEPKKETHQVKGESFEVYDFYKPTKILGHGAYAVVCEALDLRTNKSVAIKKNKGVFQELSDAKRILREIKLMMHFQHDDVMDLIGVIPPT